MSNRIKSMTDTEISDYLAVDISNLRLSEKEAARHAKWMPAVVAEANARGLR